MTQETPAHAHRRIFQEILASGESSYWMRRAATFEAVKPRPGDYIGQTTVEQRREQWRRAHATAEACRQRARACTPGSWSDEVHDVLTRSLSEGDLVERVAS